MCVCVFGCRITRCRSVEWACMCSRAGAVPTTTKKGMSKVKGTVEGREEDDWEEEVVVGLWAE